MWQNPTAAIIYGFPTPQYAFQLPSTNGLSHIEFQQVPHNQHYRGQQLNCVTDRQEHRARTVIISSYQTWQERHGPKALRSARTERTCFRNDLPSVRVVKCKERVIRRPIAAGNTKRAQREQRWILLQCSAYPLTTPA